MPSSIARAATAVPGSRILVVDNEADVVELLKLLLEREGHRVHAFTSSLDALDFARHHAVDAAVLDVNMPAPDGIALAHLLQADPRTRHVAIAFHTSLPAQVVRAAYDHEAIHLRKPASGQAIVSGVERLLSERMPVYPAAPNAAFLYVSRLCDGTPPGTVAAITRQSRIRNAVEGITGVLAFDGESFAQFIEGPPRAIDRLRDRLLRDVRHHAIEILSFGPAPLKRRFPGWWLGYHPATAGGAGIERLRGLGEHKAIAAFEAMLPEFDVDAGMALPA